LNTGHLPAICNPLNLNGPSRVKKLINKGGGAPYQKAFIRFQSTFHAVSFILLPDKDGLLCNGCSPQLPYAYLTAIEGWKPNAYVGTCAAAAATGDAVITKNFQADNKWAELRHLSQSLGFVGAWGLPIKNWEGTVIGTFLYQLPRKTESFQGGVHAVKQFATAAAFVPCNE
jgi:hypothetical protein